MMTKIKTSSRLFLCGLFAVFFIVAGNIHLTAQDGDAIVINSVAELQKIGQDDAYPLDGHYVLNHGLDAYSATTGNGGNDFLPIGSEAHPFVGCFDGQGHTISGLTVYVVDHSNAGLFSALGNGGQIKNLNLEKTVIAGLASVGGIAAINDGGEIRQCGFEGIFASIGYYWYNIRAGGLVGINRGEVVASHATCKIMNTVGFDVFGGLIGENHGTVSECHATVDTFIHGSRFDVFGGLIGENHGTVSECHAVVDTFMYGGRFDVFGGLIGENYGTASECYAIVSVDVRPWDSAVGGLIGVNHGQVTNCKASGNVTLHVEDDYQTCVAGGLIGKNHGPVSRSHATANISCTTPSRNTFTFGGLVGDNEAELTLCWAAGAVKVFNDAGDECCDPEPTVAGGLVGTSSGTVTQCYAAGEVTANGICTAGGLLGKNQGSVTQCYTMSQVQITGKSRGVGGLIGDNAGTVVECYSPGMVSASDEFTGGYYYRRRFLGGLCGSGTADSVTSSYWNNTTCNLGRSAGGERRSTAEMTWQYNRNETYVNWDFDNVWVEDVDAQNNRGYPYLKDLPPLWSLTFLNSTGNLIDSIVGSSGTTVTAPASPPRSGFLFLGWDQPVPDTLPAENLTIKALEAARPIAISTIQELQKIGRDREYPADAHYFLTNDLDASPTSTWNDGAGFIPIGTGAAPFCGRLDGRGHRITGLYISRPQEAAVGLFACIGREGVVSNLGLTGGSVAGHVVCGGLAANNAGIIESCFATVAVLGKHYVGGLVGLNDGVLRHCYARGSVSGHVLVGGLAGGNTGVVAGCYATGAVSGDGRVGGLLAKSEGGVTASYWDSESTNQENSEGGTKSSTAAMTLPLEPPQAYVDWDFQAVWIGDEGLNNQGYPCLRRCPPAELPTWTLSYENTGIDMISPLVCMAGTTIIPPEPQWVGHTFVDWQPAIPAVMPAEDLVVTAQWVENIYTVTFSPGAHGAFPGQEQAWNLAIQHGMAFSELPVITPQPGYLFVGWEPPLPAIAASDLEVCAQYEQDLYDSDSDHIPDWWEMLHFGHLDWDENDDPDADQYTNWEEFVVGSDPDDRLSHPTDFALVVWYDAVYKLQRIGLALQAYAVDHGVDAFPGRLQHLVDEGYIDAFMLCAIGDMSQGTDPCPFDADHFVTAYEPGISFFYEMNDTPCTWSLPGPDAPPLGVTWYELKMYQLMSGAGYSWGFDSRPFDRRAFPVVRFFWAIDNSIRGSGSNGTSINLAIDYRTVFASENEWEFQSTEYLPDDPAVIRPFGYGPCHAQHTVPFRLPLWFAVKDVGLDFNLRLVPTEGQGDGEIYGEIQDCYYILTPDLDTPEQLTVTVAWDDETGQVCQATFDVEVEPIAVTLYFETDGGSEVAPITLNYGAEIEAPEPPVKAHHTFVGWEPPLPATMPATDMTLTAQWKPNEYILSYIAGENGTISGQDHVKQTVTHGQDAAPVTAMPNDGYRFLKWSDGVTSAVRTDLEVVASLNVIAEFEPKWKPTLEWLTPESVVYGTELSTIQLAATANTPGTFVYDPPIGAVLPADTHVLHVVFTPDESANWALAEKTVDFTVNQAPLLVTPDAGQSKTFGAVEPALTYTSAGAMVGETPAFIGALTRAVGEDVGTYAITQGNLALVDNAPFLAANYSLVFVDGVTFAITAKDASALAVADIAAVVYNGAAQTPTPEVKDGDTVLVNGVDYTLSYAANTNAGIATVTITGMGNYGGSQDVAFTIAKAELLVTPDAGQSKTFGAVEPALTYTSAGAMVGETPAFTGELTRAVGEDVGTYAIGQGNLALVDNAPFLAANYSLVFVDEVTFAITPKDASALAVADIAAVVYNGAAQTPMPEVKDGDAVLVNGVDYTLSYAANTNAGIATATVTGMGNYSGSQDVAFTIAKAELLVTPDAGQSKTFGAVEPALTYTSAGAIAGETPAFTGELTRAVGEDVGTYAIGQGNLALVDNAPFLAANYSLVFVDGVTFAITAKDASSLAVADIAAVVYNGTAQTPTPEVKDGDAVLVNGVDYTLSCAANINAGIATVTITGMGNYGGTQDKTFAITKASATLVIADSAYVYDGTAKTVTVTTEPAGLAVTVTYNDGVNAPVNAGVYAVAATVDEQNWQGAAEGELVISQAVPTIVWPAPAPIVQGMVLSAAQLKAEADTPGRFDYAPPAGTVLPVGVHVLSATFTPDDGANWLTPPAPVSIELNVVAGVVMWLTAIPANGTAPVALAFGETATATNDLDVFDVVAEPGQGAVLCSLPTSVSAKLHLTHDFRPDAGSIGVTRWRIKVTESEDAGERQRVTLQWDIAAAAFGRELYLQKLIT
jgi:hypothetical protein